MFIRKSGNQEKTGFSKVASGVPWVYCLSPCSYCHICNGVSSQITCCCCCATNMKRFISLCVLWRGDVCAHGHARERACSGECETRYHFHMEGMSVCIAKYCNSRNACGLVKKKGGAKDGYAWCAPCSVMLCTTRGTELACSLDNTARNFATVGNQQLGNVPQATLWCTATAGDRTAATPLPRQLLATPTMGNETVQKGA